MSSVLNFVRRACGEWGRLFQYSLAVLLAGGVFCSASVAQNVTTRWVATWSASPSPQLSETEMRNFHLVFQNQTLREIIHTSAGGETVRVRVSNLYGTGPLTLDSVHIALSAQASDIVPESDRILTFNARSSVTIPPGAIMISDPLSLAVPADSNLSISFFLATNSFGAGIHYLCKQTNYIGNGDQTGAEWFMQTTTIDSWVFLAGVDVSVPDGGGAIVIIGDSYSEGGQSTLNANHRWPNYLGGRLVRSGVSNISVVNSAIGANRILHDPPIADNPLSARFGVNALARFDRDVLAVPGVKWLIILIGAPDLNLPGTPGGATPISETVTAEDVIGGLQQMAARAHEMGLKVIGCTPMPLLGHPNYTPEKDAKRKVVNDWIRNTDVFDAMLDFDLALRDPDQPERLLPLYDSGDHIHPGDAGYEKMASMVDLMLFK